MDSNDFYVSSFKRLLVYIIDAIIVGITLSLIFGETNSERIQIIQVILFLCYFILMQNYFGQTLGQKIFKLKIVDSKSGDIPSLKQIFLRELGTLTAWTGIGLMIGQFTYSYNSGFYWDRWTGIKVIPSGTNLHDFNSKLEEDRQRLFPDKV